MSGLLTSNGVHVAGLGFEVETRSGDLFAIATSEDAADLVVDAVNEYITTLSQEEVAHVWRIFGQRPSVVEPNSKSAPAPLGAADGRGKP